MKIKIILNFLISTLILYRVQGEEGNTQRKIKKLFYKN